MKRFLIDLNEPVPLKIYNKIFKIFYKRKIRKEVAEKKESILKELKGMYKDSPRGFFKELNFNIHGVNTCIYLYSHNLERDRIVIQIDRVRHKIGRVKYGQKKENIVDENTLDFYITQKIAEYYNYKFMNFLEIKFSIFFPFIKLETL